jgi:hypothetical protein
MPEMRERPMPWGIVGVIAAVVLAVVVVVAVRSGDDSAESGADRGGLTRTEVDIDDPLSDGNTLRATVIADDGDRCVWLVNVAGADPGTRLILAWPDGARLEWDPFAVRLDGSTTITQGTTITASGELLAGDEDLDDASFERLLGQFRCPYDGVFVADADGDSVVVRGGG